MLCCVGANWLIRKMAGASSPDLDITQDGDKFHIKLHSLVQTKETEFNVNEEFEETQQNGVVMKVITEYVYLLLSFMPLTHLYLLLLVFSLSFQT